MAIITTTGGARRDAYGPFFSAGGSPADSTTYYLGLGNIQLSTTDTSVGTDLGYAHIVVGAVVSVSNNTTSGTNENVGLYHRNVTTGVSTFIGNIQTNASTSSTLSFSFTGLSILVGATDDECFEIRTPAWATNPVALQVRVYAVITYTSL